MFILSFISQVLIVIAALGPGLVAVLVLVKPHIKNARLATGLDIAQTLVAAAVANAQQTVVNPLKDPTKPGEWTPTMASKTKNGVIEDVKSNAPEIFEQLHTLGIAWPTMLISQMVEQNVLAQKAAQPLVGTEIVPARPNWPTTPEGSRR